MADITITLETTPEGGRYVGRVDGNPAEAELTYRRAAEGLVIANHTFAPPAMRGTGIALALVERIVADARAQGFKIRPTCSYVVTQAKRHPEWADVMLE